MNPAKGGPVDAVTRWQQIEQQLADRAQIEAHVRAVVAGLLVIAEAVVGPHPIQLPPGPERPRST